MARLQATEPFVHPDCVLSEAALGRYVEIGRGSRIAHAELGDYSYCDRYCDIANARVRMASGCVANLTASRISVEQVRRVRLFQGRTYLACDTVKREVERYQLVMGAEGKPTIARDELPIEDGEPLGIELAAFVNAVRARSRPPVDGDQGRRVLELALKIREAVDASMRR